MGQMNWDALIDGWANGKPASDHLVLEAEHARLLGYQAGDPLPLADGAAVPGCGCGQCSLAQHGLDPDGLMVAESLVRNLSRLSPCDRGPMAAQAVTSWLKAGVILPSASLLADLATKIPGARKNPLQETRWKRPLPVESAKHVPILVVANRLGLDLRRTGNSWRGPCPIHGGEGPNFVIYLSRGIFNCFVCGAKGDGIELYRRVRDVGFPDAVRELAR